jgi:hypothetical protein
LTTTFIPDTSEFQSTVDCRKLPAVILRAHNGHRADRQFQTRWAQARKCSTVRMAYGYVVQNRDPVAQAKEFAAIVGRLQPGEMVWCDLEEGAGDQTARADAWCQTVDDLCGGKAGVYSGEAFFSAHLGGVTRTRWVAAYRATEPRGPHLLWQNTDKSKGPGVSGPHDESVFHGSVQELRAVIDRQQGRTAAVAKHTSNAPKPAKVVRSLVQFQGQPAVWEILGSDLHHVTRAAWDARGLSVKDVQVLPTSHPLAALAKVNS